jgi:hypothetical protein
MKKKIKYKPFWYYFGKCVPYPMRVKEGNVPSPPYKMFKTKKACQEYIDADKKEVFHACKPA